MIISCSEPEKYNLQISLVGFVCKEEVNNSHGKYTIRDSTGVVEANKWSENKIMET